MAASEIHPHDTRRMIRALEVFRATGEPISHQQMQFDEGRRADECRVFVLRRERRELHRRIEGRVSRRCSTAGLVDEVRGLTAGGKRWAERRARRSAIARCSSIWPARSTRSKCSARIKVRTRRFAKRQGTWFRSLSECRFVDMAGEVDAAAVASEIVAAGSV